jgi:hypothetical protein
MNLALKISQKESRRENRHNATRFLPFTFLLGSSTKAVTAELVNISKNGLAIQTSHGLMVGTTLRLAMLAKNISFKVVSCRTSAAGNISGLMGIEQSADLETILSSFY